MAINPKAVMVIKSTIPARYTLRTCEALGTQNLIFSREFLREGRALPENLYPRRIVVVGNPQAQFHYKPATPFEWGGNLVTLYRNNFNL